MSKYKGWVPVVGKRLSFSILGETDYPTPSICVNVADESLRYLVIYQKRYLSDQPIPWLPDKSKNFISKMLFKTDGMFWFLCIAETPSTLAATNSNMSGKIYIFTDKRIWRTAIEPHVKQAQAKLSKFDYREHGCLDSYVSSHVQPHLQIPERDNLYCAKFELERNGIATIEKIDQEAFLASSILYKDYRNNSLEELNEEEMLAQAYFYLKDLAHTHQHHHYRTDTITDLYRYNGKDSFWMGATLRSLYRKVLEYKRSSSRNDGVYYSSQGVLAYANTFKEIAEEILDEDEIEALPLRHHGNISQSIQASQDQINLRQTKLNEAKQIYINLAFAFAGTLIALASLSSLDESIDIRISDSYVEGVLGLIVNEPINLILGAVTLTTFYAMISGRVNWRRAGILDIVRIVVRMKKWVAAATLVLLGLGFGLLTILTSRLVSPVFSLISKIFGID